MISLKNLPIMVKVFIAPLAILSILIGISLISLHGFSVQRKALDQIVHIARAKTDLVGEMMNEVTATQTALSQILAMSDSGIEDAKIQSYVQAVHSHQGKVHDLLDVLNTRFSLDDGERAAVQETAQALINHGKSAETLMDLAALDRTIAIPQMPDTEDKFNVLTGATAALIAMEREKAEVLYSLAVKEADSAQSLFLILAGLAMALSLGLTLLTSRLISRPVRALTDVMTRLADGDMGVDIPARDNRDEIGHMARAVLVFKENAQRFEQLRTEQEIRKVEMEQKDRQTRHELAGDFEATVGRVLTTVQNAAEGLHGTARGLAKGADDTSIRSSAVASASKQASANVAAMANGSEHIHHSIEAIRDRVSQSTVISRRAVEMADRASGLISGLRENSHRISDVVNLITDIASQTNLLALNATIEAARAGDAGKGFAVVAQEVKNLATQTGRATGEIAEQTTSIQTATLQAVEAIEAIGQVISEINEATGMIASSVEDQRETTASINQNAQEIAQGTHQVTTHIEGLRTAAEHTGLASRDMVEAAEKLTGEFKTLHAEVANFLTAVRSA
ncbi:MAG: HAMP domain-containing protein [Rhodospirillum sp.]|nr:HAMP domain-containing protein [Rhodospirillum sp.]